LQSKIRLIPFLHNYDFKAKEKENKARNVIYVGYINMSQVRRKHTQTLFSEDRGSSLSCAQS